MPRSAIEVLEKYIAGKDLDQHEILENIYIEDAKVSFEIKSKSISFPDEIIGNKKIAQVLSAEFNKKYDFAKTYYLSRNFPQIDELTISNQSWLVVMRDKVSNHVRVGAGHYDWVFEKLNNSQLKIKKHNIFIGVMLELQVPLEFLNELQNKLEYPWVEEEQVAQVLSNYDILREIKEYLQN